MPLSPSHYIFAIVFSALHKGADHFLYCSILLFPLYLPSVSNQSAPFSKWYILLLSIFRSEWFPYVPGHVFSDWACGTQKVLPFLLYQQFPGYPAVLLWLFVPVHSGNSAMVQEICLFYFHFSSEGLLPFPYLLHNPTVPCSCCTVTPYLQYLA